MTAPKRIQLSRRKGWKMPAGCVKVDRSTRWGNAFRVVAGDVFDGLKDARRKEWRVVYCPPSCLPEDVAEVASYEAKASAIACAVRLHAGELRDARVDVSPLRGKSLGCWCKTCPEHAAGKPFDVDCSACAPCHADTLGKLSNTRVREQEGSAGE